ncbi:hypothetical protein [Actinomadura opuntiae]|uniref:hypothetical protein n=1 Tax=Actinomadura sp. OS1-43 TaxID=604315 RepID=UPI00255B240F|nr:hypothetical protein [Actinomadura sp. OS1-43]MDL4820828.1 hypothetical protein [Actinomadura sp. OS1-43]
MLEKPAKLVALAGPELPVVSADIALVPQHPQTGEVWRPSGAAEVVPVAADVWTRLAFSVHLDRMPVPVTGGISEVSGVATRRCRCFRADVQAGQWSFPSYLGAVAGGSSAAAPYSL